MNPSIRILDESVANQIAAGEVVERPASIIKELVENSLDAGAGSISIEIVNGGTALICVTDDGCGLNAADARLSIVRHATSKIFTADDLNTLSSLGFRGEALPSIAAVSKLIMITRLAAEPLGTQLIVHAGNIIDVNEIGANVGTRITVEDLFYNTPARQKFLKSPSAESSQIHLLVVRLALSRPDIAFRLINNGKLVFATPGKSSLTEVISCVYGHKITPDLLTLPLATAEHININGCIGKPNLIKGSRQWQTFIVNGRIISNRMLSKAVDNAFHSLIPHNGFPLVVLSIQLASTDVDVNIHPQKSEVKFLDDQAVYRAVYRAVSQTLTDASRQAQSIAASYNYSSDTQTAARPLANITETLRQPALSFQQYVQPTPSLSVIKESLAQVDQQDQLLRDQNSAVIPNTNNGELEVLGQVDNCYIIAQGAGGLYIVDQHAAHERILYDKLQQQNSNGVHKQSLLMPIMINFDLLENQTVEQSLPILAELGFVLELIGPGMYRLIEIPATIQLADAESLLKEALRLIIDMRTPSLAEIRHAYLQTASCRAAIKAGDSLNHRQLQAILDELCLTEHPFSCPHGRPAMIRFSSDELSKMFKRT